MTTILVVDDYLITQRVLSTQLRNRGYQTMTARSGVDALDVLDQAQIDLAIVDLEMPVMDGLTLLKHIRMSKVYKQLPVIMLTASGRDQDRIAAREEGVDEFLTKPISSWDLVDTVNHYL